MSGAVATGLHYGDHLDRAQKVGQGDVCFTALANTAQVHGSAPAQEATAASGGDYVLE